MACTTLTSPLGENNDNGHAKFSPLDSKRCRLLSPPGAQYHASPLADSARRQPVLFAAGAKRRNDDDLDTDDDDAEPTSQSPFVPRSRAAPAEDFLPADVRRRRRKLAAHNEQKSSSSLVPRHVPAAAPVSLTLEQFKSIIEQAVKSREDQLTAEFNQVLSQKLAEQFDQFQRYSQDYLHRRMESSTFSYMS
eukprot:TRINITY_DN9632_c0_g1_i1.p2 TRINITY_DN9632_c0_g1~~TRINITY_DN9632_c0_g1_i1.p2  ORF type:complete len:192 (+),score=22.85 TRINITY_DN9632_c0_g1_i1:1651-2226(+)